MVPQPRRAIGGLMVAKPPEMGSRGGKNGREMGREGQPNLAPLTTTSPTQLSSLVVGEGWGTSWLWPPISQPILSELQAFLGVNL